MSIMKRFFGMMPTSEVEIEKKYKDKNGHDVTIQAGPNGWTILWYDGGSSWKDEENTAEENFNTAFKTAEESVGTLTENTEPKSYQVVEASEACDEDESCGESWEG